MSTLTVGNEQTIVTAGPHPDATVTFAIGTNQLVRACFHDRFPGPGGLESAIEVVEDEFMRLRPLPPGPVQFTVTDALLREIVRRANPGDPAGASIGEIERLFSRLVAVADGSPSQHQDIPEDAAFAATLVIVRELMHHWPVPALQVQRG